MAASARPPMGEAASLWSAALGPLVRKEFAEAKKLASEAQTRSQSAGNKMGQAAASLTTALADFGAKAPGPAAEMLGLFQELGITWGEAAALISTAKSGAPLSTGSWAKVVAAAAKAEAPGLADALKLAGDVGLFWAETGAAATADDVHLTRKAGDAMTKEAAKDAVASAKSGGNLIAESTANIALAKAFSADDSFVPAMQAASEALRSFKGLGHKRGEASALCAIAKIAMDKQLPEDASWKAREALKIYRQLGDRKGEVAALLIEASALLAKQDQAKALQSTTDAKTLAEELADRFQVASSMALQAKAYIGQGEDEPALKTIKDAVIIAKDLGDVLLEGVVTDVFVDYYFFKGVPEDGVMQVQILIDHYKQLGDQKGQASTLLKKASVQMQSEEYDNALRSVGEALTLSKSVQDRKGEASAYKMQAQLRYAKEDAGEALQAAEQACEIFREIGDKFGRVGFLTCVEVMINSYVSQQAVDLAFNQATEAMKFFIETKDKKGEGAMLMALADLNLAVNNNDMALKAIAGAPTAFAAADDKRGEAVAKAKLATIYFQKGKAGDSLRAAEDAANGFRTMGDLVNLGSMLQLIADSHFMLAGNGMGNGVEALRASQEAVATYRQLQDKSSEAMMLHSCSNAQLMTKNFKDAQQTAQACQALFKELDDKKGEAGALLLVAGAFLALGEFEEARRTARDARDIFQSADDGVGEDSCEDFLDSLKKYEKGDLNSKDFMGFAMRGGDPSSTVREKKKKAGIGAGAVQGADIELFANEQLARDTVRNTVLLFECFESRRATAPGVDAMKKRKGSEAKDDVLAPGMPAPSKSAALYVVKWVADHTLEERGVQFAPGFEKLSEKKMAQTVLPTKSKLTPPRPNFPARTGTSNRGDNLLKALARKHKVESPA